MTDLRKGIVKHMALLSTNRHPRNSGLFWTTARFPSFYDVCKMPVFFRLPVF